MDHSLPDRTVPALSQVFRIAALIRRERRTRFAGGAFGYLWTFLTPLAWIALVVLTFRLLNRAPPVDVSPEIFVATGILPYVTFRQTVSALSRSAIANRYLLYFAPVSMAEILLATAVLELLNLMVTATLIFGLILILQHGPLPHDPLRVFLGLVLAWGLGAGFGRFAAVLGQWSDTFARALPWLLRPVFWVSGIFYIASEMPGSAQALLVFSPLLHAIEILRQGFFLGFVSPISSPWIPASVALSFYLASLLIERFVRQQRRTRHRI